MVSFQNIVTVLVTVCLINIFIHTSLSWDTVNGKYSLDSSFDPIESQQECNNYYTKNEKVCDPQTYITYPMKEKLGEIMERAKNIPTISCPFKTDGIEFGVFIMSSFDDYHSHKRNQGFDIGESSKFYAKLFHEKWEIGSEECNNGILIFLNIEDRYLYVSTSTFIKQNYISDDYINNQIMPNIKSYLKDGEYADGIIKIMELITDKCQEKLVDKIVESESTKEDIHRQEREKQEREQIEKEEIGRNKKRERIERERRERERREQQKQERNRKEKEMKENRFSDNNNIKVDDDGIRIFVGIMMMIFSIYWLLWFMGYDVCCCCGSDDNVDNYRDEGVPSQSQRNRNYSRSHLQQHTMDEPHTMDEQHTIDEPGMNNYNDSDWHRDRQEMERKERERKRRQKEREERERQERERRMRENKAKEAKLKLENNAKRTKNGGGGGMDWNDNMNNKRRTTNNDGGGMSWNNDNYQNERDRQEREKKERLQKEREREERERKEREKKERERQERERRERERAREERERKERLQKERERQERERKEREKKEREKKQRENKDNTNNKRTTNNDGAGMSWNDDDDDDDDDDEREKLEKDKNESLVNNGKRTNEGGGVGLSWNNHNNKRTSNGGGCGMSWSNNNNKKASKFKRTNANDGGGGSW